MNSLLESEYSTLTNIFQLACSKANWLLDPTKNLDIDGSDTQSYTGRYEDFDLTPWQNAMKKASQARKNLYFI